MADLLVLYTSPPPPTSVLNLPDVTWPNHHLWLTDSHGKKNGTNADIWQVYSANSVQEGRQDQWWYSLKRVGGFVPHWTHSCGFLCFAFGSPLFQVVSDTWSAHHHPTASLIVNLWQKKTYRCQQTCLYLPTLQFTHIWHKTDGPFPPGFQQRGCLIRDEIKSSLKSLNKVSQHLR